MNSIPNWLKGKWLHLIWSNHAVERYKERCCGSLCILPEHVKITQKNTEFLGKDENRRVTFKTKFRHSSTQNLYCIIDADSTVRTCYFQKHDRKNKKVSKSTVRNGSV